MHSKAIASAARRGGARRRAIPARRVSFSLSDPARITSPSPASHPARLYAVSIVSFTPTFCPRDTLADDAARRERGDAAPRAARRRIGVTAATRREGGKGHVGYLAVPCESVCASYVVRQSTRRLRRVRGGLNINGVRRRRHRDSFPAHLGYRMRVTHRWVSPLRGSGPSHTRVPFLHTGN